VLVAVIVPLCVAVLLAAALPRFTGRLHPQAAAWVLVAGAVASATAELVTLGLLAWFVIAAIPPVAAIGGWHPGALLTQSMVPLPVSVASTGVLVVLVVRLVRGVGLHVPDARAAVKLERRLPSRRRPARLVLVDDPDPVAHAIAALPSCGGHIVVSRTLWDSLGDVGLRRAVLEHERAHLRHHHGVLLALGELARLVNPLLGPAVEQLRFQLERWADEDAARATSRATTAQAVATVALATRQRVVALGFHGASSTARVRALLADEPTQPAAPVSLLVAALAAIATVAALWACHDTELVFETLRRLSAH
jgi:Peptidase family M48